MGVNRIKNTDVRVKLCPCCSTSGSESETNNGDHCSRRPLKEVDFAFVPNGHLRTVLAFCMLFVAMTLNLVVESVIHDRVPMDTDPLPDISFKVLPYSSWTSQITEYIMIGQVSAVIFLLVFHSYRTILIRRICLIYGLLYLYRAICMIPTGVPLTDRNKYCSPQLFNYSDPETIDISAVKYVGIILSRTGSMIFTLGLNINGERSYCGDYLYSGHTVILTLSNLILNEYLVPRNSRKMFWKVVRYLLLVPSVVGVVAIPIARAHYLIDVVLAYYVTTRTFWIYHTIANNKFMRTKSSNNYLTRVWWWPLFTYFEGEPFDCCSENLRLPRVFNSPFSSPVPYTSSSRRTRSTFANNLFGETASYESLGRFKT
ncbi:Phosphatidylcholine:ceramide cholinephosphotransferase 1 [Halotydeus destructor]|nr:Phosphatidylcholine:ceramide cholinephosphotransferase 1 [Halotydeus destructor]